jgi:WD40 repeat protein
VAVPAQDLDLLKLVAQTWQIDEGIRDIVFDHGCETIAFLTENGCMHLSHVTDTDPVAGRARLQGDTSRITIAPRTKPVRPLSMFRPEEGIVAGALDSPGGGVLAVLSGGQLLRITSDGRVTPLLAETFECLSAISVALLSGRIALIERDVLRVLKPEGDKFCQIASVGSLRNPRCIALKPDGKQLAISNDETIDLYDVEEETLSKGASLPDSNGVARIDWSPTGRFIAARFDNGELGVWRTSDLRPQRMSGFPALAPQFSWGQNDRFLASSGGYRPFCWPLESSKFGEKNPKPLETGRRGIQLVTAIAAQRKGDLIAAGYGNGTVVISKAGKPDEFVIRGPDGDTVRKLTWTNDGLGLAIGAADGFAAVARFPDFLFK